MTPIKLSLSKIIIIPNWKETLFFFHTNQIVCLINKSYGTYFVLIYDIKSDFYESKLSLLKHVGISNICQLITLKIYLISR